MAGGFEQNTRQKTTILSTITRPTGGGLSTRDLPKNGLLARIYLNISGSVAGTLTSPNPLGFASIVRRVRVRTNNQIEIFNMSGAGYGYLFQQLDGAGGLGVNRAQAQNQYNTAVTATTFNLDMVIPVMMNLHDPIGLIMLQDEQLQVSLDIEWEADATVATGATVTATAIPTLEFFTVPTDPADWPRLDMVHQIIEDQKIISGAGDDIYVPPRGNIYLQLLLGAGIAAGTATDTWSRAVMRINQNDILYTVTPASLTQILNYKNTLNRGVAANLGQLPFDLLGSDGLGAYGSARDFINSKLLTDFEVVITYTGATTLYAIRRMLLPLQKSQ